MRLQVCEHFSNPWLVLIVALIALMEYHCSKDKDVASRIFEKGLKFFAEEIEYVLRHLGFLISINDENSECREAFDPPV